MVPRLKLAFGGAFVFAACQNTSDNQASPETVTVVEREATCDPIAETWGFTTTLSGPFENVVEPSLEMSDGWDSETHALQLVQWERAAGLQSFGAMLDIVPGVADGNRQTQFSCNDDVDIRWSPVQEL